MAPARRQATSPPPHRSRSEPRRRRPLGYPSPLPTSGKLRLVDAFFSNRPCAVDTFEKTARETTLANGTIKKLISERGFGFITAEDGKDYFFHKDGLAPSMDFDRLVGGESVTFEVEASPRGPRAVQVQQA